MSDVIDTDEKDEITINPLPEPVIAETTIEQETPTPSTIKKERKTRKKVPVTEKQRANLDKARKIRAEKLALRKAKEREEKETKLKQEKMEKELLTKKKLIDPFMDRLTSLENKIDTLFGGLNEPKPKEPTTQMKVEAVSKPQPRMDEMPSLFSGMMGRRV
jgi:hypothetical protein